MALRPQTSFLLGDLLAIGVARLGTDNATLYAPDGSVLGSVGGGGGAPQLASPLTGTTVVMTDDAVSGSLYLTPAGTIAALTVTLPTNANSVIGQKETIVTSQTITALTVDGATTILGNPTTLAAGGSVTFQKMAANTWARVA